MNRWLSRLDVKNQKPLSGVTAKTDKNPLETPGPPLLSVLSVLSERGFEKHDTLLSVLSVPSERGFENRDPPFVSSVSAVGEANAKTRVASNDEVGTACTDCAYLLKGGTCAEPVSASLAQSFSIVWPPEGHGATCATFSRKPTRPTEAPSSASPYLSKAGADRCHTPAWSEAEMFTFTTRSAKFVRIGLRPDADHLAELLTLRDRDGDDRRLCFECQHYRPGRCGNHASAGLQAPDLSRGLAGLLQRCPGFTS